MHFVRNSSEFFSIFVFVTYQHMFLHWIAVMMSVLTTIKTFPSVLSLIWTSYWKKALMTQVLFLQVSKSLRDGHLCNYWQEKNCTSFSAIWTICCDMVNIIANVSPQHVFLFLVRYICIFSLSLNLYISLDDRSPTLPVLSFDSLREWYIMDFSEWSLTSFSLSISSIILHHLTPLHK